MRSSDIWIAPQAVAALLAAAKTSERAEPCGILLGYHVPRGAEVLEAVALPNAHPSPERGFHLQPETILRAARAGRERGLDLVGFWHVHLEGPAWPGMFDEEGMRAAHAEGLGPYVHLVGGKGSTGKNVVRGFRLGRTRAKQIPIHALSRPRGSQRAQQPEAAPSL